MAVVVKLVALLGFAFMFVWTLVTGREEVPLTERSQVVAVSEEEAAALGAQAFAEVLGRFEPVRSGLELEATSSRTRRRGSSFAHSRFSNKKRRRPPPTVLCDSSEAISSRRGGSRRSGERGWATTGEPADKVGTRRISQRERLLPRLIPILMIGESLHRS